MSSEHDEYRSDRPRYDISTPVADRVKGPAIFLLIVAVLNLIGAGLLFLTCLIYSQATPEMLASVWNEHLNREQRAEMEAAGMTPESFRDLVVFWSAVWGGVALVAGLLTLAGSVRMMVLKSYGLAVTGAILAALPFISCSGCLLLGQAAGIWALVVLFSADVRSAFR
jgi:hypothetical protein